MQPDSGHCLPNPRSCAHASPASHPVPVRPQASGPALKVPMPPVLNFAPEIN